MYAKMSGPVNHEASTSKDQTAGRNIQSSVPSRRGTLKFYRAFNQKTNSNLLSNAVTGVNGTGIPIPAKVSPEKKGTTGDANSNQLNGMNAQSAYFAQGGN